MNKLILKPALIVLTCMTTFAYAEAPKSGCDIKAAKIQTQIDYAKAHGNTHKVAGLEKALAEVKENCSDKDLKAELNEKVADKQQKVTEREADLKEAETKGDVKKIAKQKKKLAEAQQELKEAQQKSASYSK